MKKIILSIVVSFFVSFTYGQTDSIFIEKTECSFELPKTITLSDGSVISYKKWCRRYDKASRKARRKLNRKIKNNI